MVGAALVGACRVDDAGAVRGAVVGGPDGAVEVAEVLVALLGRAGRIELDEEQLLTSITARPIDARFTAALLRPTHAFVTTRP